MMKKEGSPKTSMEEFCPICQVPLSCLKIPAALHTAHCLIEPDENPCPEGKACHETSIHHYRDYNHSVLALWRCSPDYIPSVSQHPVPPKSTKKRASLSPLSLASKIKKLKPPESEKVDGILTDDVRKALFKDEQKNEVFSVLAETHEKTNIAKGAKTESHYDSTKKRTSASPLSLASKMKKPKPPESEKVDSILTDDVRKALFKDEQKNEVFSVLAETHEKTNIAKGAKTESHYDSRMDSSFLCDGTEKYVPVPQKSQVKPLKCDVKFEYNAYEASSETSVMGQQSACSPSCLSPGDGEELQAVCTVNIKASVGKPQDAAAKSPVHVNLLLNESGWEAVQVDGSSSAKVREVDISLCKCARAMTLKCLIADPKISAQSSNQKEVKIEHKYSARLDELGLKKTMRVQDKTEEHIDAHKKVDISKTKSTQLTIKTFFTSEKDDKNSGVSTKSLLEPNGYLQPTKRSSSKPSHPKSPMILLAGSSASRPLTPVILGAQPSVSRVAGFKPSISESSKPRRRWGNSTAPVPLYKRIPDTPFVVDAFKWGAIEGVRAYFLSHFHSDHYIGLTKDFNQPIYCSKITADLIRLKIRVDPKFLHILEIGEPRVVCNVEVEVFDANHCPGSLMFLFRLLDGRSILHVGDFRASTSMEEIRCLRQVDILYLDTTYCDPAYDFPSQAEVVREVVRTAKTHVERNPSTLFCCGSYTIGKEKVFLNLAEALDCKIWTSKDKAKILQCLGNDITAKRLVSNPAEAALHVVYMKDINFQTLDILLQDAGPSYTSLVAFEPTGWTTSKVGSPSLLKKTSKGRVTIYAVPYSEHSSFSELRRFVRFVRPKKIQVTVNLGKQRLYQKYFKQWLESTGGDQVSLDAFFTK